MKRWPNPPRPTEYAALRAVRRSPRQLLPVEVLLDRLVLAHRARDRAGVSLCAHAAVRAANLGGEGR